MSTPSTTTRPRSGLSRPTRDLRNTVLPVPDGPSITLTSPAGSDRLTSRQTVCPPKDLVSPSMTTSTPIGPPAGRAASRASILVRNLASVVALACAPYTLNAIVIPRRQRSGRIPHSSHRLSAAALAAIPRMLPASILNLHTFHGQGRRSCILTGPAGFLSCAVRGSMDGPRQPRRAARVAGRRAQAALGQDAEVGRPEMLPTSTPWRIVPNSGSRFSPTPQFLKAGMFTLPSSGPPVWSA